MKLKSEQEVKNLWQINKILNSKMRKFFLTVGAILFFLVSFNFHISNLHVWAVFSFNFAAFSIYIVLLLLPSCSVIVVAVYLNLRWQFESIKLFVLMLSFSELFLLLALQRCVIEDRANILNYWMGKWKFRVAFFEYFVCLSSCELKLCLLWDDRDVGKGLGNILQIFSVVL